MVGHGCGGPIELDTFQVLFRGEPLPSEYEQAAKQTWNLHTLFNQLRRVGFDSQTARQVFYQPVSLVAALEIARE